MLSRWIRFIVFAGLLVSLFLGTTKVHGTHIVGADLSYRCLGGLQYEVTLSFYRDCGGLLPLTAYTIFISSASCPRSFILTVPQRSVREVSPLCPAMITSSTCNGGGQPGVQEYIYRDTVTLPLACADWKFTYREGNRNGFISTITSPGASFMYIEATLNNLDAPCNSSPVFNNVPVTFICRNQNYLYNHVATDADGDLLKFVLVDALDDFGVIVPYISPFSGANPLTSTPAVRIDSVSGTISINPTNQQVGLMAVRVEEYRNGQLIGSVIRDMQVTVLNCANNAPSVLPMQGLSGGVLIGTNSIMVCPNVALSFFITGRDLDVLDTLTMTAITTIPGLTFTHTGINEDTAFFSWTPTIVDTGIHNMVINLSDSACPIPGNQTFAVSIRVLDHTTVGPDQSICQGTGGTAVLSAIGGNVFSWTVLSGDVPSLTCGSCQTQQVAPTVTTTYEVVSDYGCRPNDTITIHVVPSIQANALRDTLLCGGAHNVQLSGTGIGAGPFNYIWSPNTKLSNAGIPNPIANPDTSTTYLVTVTTPNGCIAADSVRIDVENIRLSLGASPAAICQNAPVTLFSGAKNGDCNDYTVSSIPYAFTAGSGTSVNLGDDQMSSALPIGFNFDFFCNTYNSIFLSSNGWLAFTSGLGSSFTSQSLPDLATPNELIAFAWDDLDPSKGGTIEYFTTGTAPNQKLVINFIDIRHCCSSGSPRVSVQAVLYEGSNFIEFHNTNINHDNSNMTQGIEDQNGLIGYTVPGHNFSTWSATNEAWRFSSGNQSYTLNWFSPPGTPLGLTTDNIGVSPSSAGTYQVVIQDLSGNCTDTAELTLNVASMDVSADTCINVTDSASLRSIYSGPVSPAVCDSYTVALIGYSPINTQVGSIAVSLGDDQVSSAIPIGFSFDYYCNSYTDFHISSNGWISFSPSAISKPSPDAIPDIGLPQNLIALTWADLDPTAGGTIRYRRIGAAPNRRLIVEYNQIPFFGSVSALNTVVQVILYEGSNEIEIHSIDIQSNGSVATQGIENDAGTRGEAVPMRNLATFTAFQDAYRFTPVSGGLTYTWSPATAISNPNIANPRVSPGVATTYVLTIDNGDCIMIDSINVCLNPLPLELLGFEAKLIQAESLLEWLTLDEKNTSHFVIERSGNGEDFQAIGSKPAQGQSRASQNYDFIDAKPLFGYNFYRLKMMDQDGSFSFSKIEEIYFESEEKLRVFPNPASGFLHFSLKLEAEQDVKIKLFDLNGRLVASKIKKGKSNEKFGYKLPISKLPAGLYIYELVADGKRMTGKTQKVN